MAAAGEASSKLSRFLCFVGAGVICTKAINTYRDYEHKKEASAAVAAAEAALASAAEAEPAPATAGVGASPRSPDSRAMVVLSKLQEKDNESADHYASIGERNRSSMFNNYNYKKKTGKKDYKEP